MKLKLAIIDTYTPPKELMPDWLAKYYQHIDVYSHSVLSAENKVRSRAAKPNSHGSLGLFFATRPLWDIEAHCIEYFTSDGMGTLPDFFDALDLCLEIGAHVVNFSGGFNSIGVCDMHTLKKKSDKLLANNAVLCASAGNSGWNAITGAKNLDSICFPARLDQWFCIGSDQDGKRSYFSSIGDQVDFTFDGDAEEAVGLNMIETVSGTSFSCPKAAGTVARLIQESWKLGHPIRNYRDALMFSLPFMAKRKRNNTFDMIELDEELGAGSMEHLYDALTTTFDRFKEDNEARIQALKTNSVTSP